MWVQERPGNGGVMRSYQGIALLVCRLSDHHVSKISVGAFQVLVHFDPLVALSFYNFTTSGYNHIYEFETM